MNVKGCVTAEEMKSVSAAMDQAPFLNAFTVDGGTKWSDETKSNMIDSTDKAALL